MAKFSIFLFEPSMQSLLNDEIINFIQSITFQRMLTTLFSSNAEVFRNKNARWVHTDEEFLYGWCALLYMRHGITSEHQFELSWAFLSWKHQWNGNFSIIFFNCLKFMHKQIKFRRSNVEYLWLWAIKACFQLTMNTDWCIFQQAVTQKKQHRLNEKNEKKKQNTFPYIRTTHHPCINSTTKGWYAFEGSWADSKLP